MESSTQQGQASSAFLASVDILSSFTPGELEQLAEAVETRAYAFGDTVCSAGDAADGLYLVKSGSVRLFSEEHGKESSMGLRKAGEVFAEVAMLRPYRHELSARAALKTELWFIPRAAIEPVLARNPAALDFINNYVAISSAGGLVARLFDLRGKVGKPELDEFVRSVGVKRVAAGREILQQGARDDRRLYVVRQGQVRVVVRDRDGSGDASSSEPGDEFVLATLGPGEIFGEKACLMRQEQPASVVAAGEAVLLVIPEKSAHFILERNARFRDVVEERVRFFERELQRQKRLAERRRRPVILDLASQPKAGDKIIKRFAWVEQAEEMDCGAACLVAEAAARIRFENIDKDNFLRIVAPVDGVITDVTSTQPGDKIQANAPLGGIAPKNARPILKIDIAEHDRGFLREGLPVQVKFNAFPYQRYGLIRGTLQFISPATKPSPQTRQPVYEGRVSLEQVHYTVGETTYPLRYGMTAVAEIVVRERRLIDLALDPFRNIGG